MAYPSTYGYDQSYDPERQIYYDTSIYHPDASLFTQQELYAFEPAQFSLDQASFFGGVEGAAGMGCWDMQLPAKSASSSMGYGEFYDMPMMDFAPQEQQGGYCAASVEGDTTSCQTSPFMDEDRLPFHSSFQYPASPVTPTGSPLLQCGANAGVIGQPPPTLLMVPVQSNGQYQYNAYPVAQLPVDGGYYGELGYEQSFESQHPSPYTIPSLTASPLARETPAQEEAEDGQQEENDEEEEEEEEDDRSVIPNHGNKELRGMGLYDDTPDLIYPGCSTPCDGSPITPHDQLRPTLGKGLVLEQSFGLPEKMMIKDEETGEIIEGKLRIDDEYEDEEEMY